MGKLNFPVISIGELTGSVTASVSLTAAAVVIPTMANGTLPKFLYCIAVGGTAGNYVVISPTTGAVGDETTGIPLVIDNPIGIILNVHGFSHIGTEAVGTADSDLHLIPLEDF